MSPEEDLREEGDLEAVVKQSRWKDLKRKGRQVCWPSLFGAGDTRAFKGSCRSPKPLRAWASVTSGLQGFGRVSTPAPSRYKPSICTL